VLHCCSAYTKPCVPLIVRKQLCGCHLGRQGECVSLQGLSLVQVPALQRHPLDAVSRRVSLQVVERSGARQVRVRL
jgi:hypothetical protein